MQKQTGAHGCGKQMVVIGEWVLMTMAFSIVKPSQVSADLLQMLVAKNSSIYLQAPC
jgi:hypothetical protein